MTIGYQTVINSPRPQRPVLGWSFHAARGGCLFLEDTMATQGRSPKTITYHSDDRGCFICDSHSIDPDGYPQTRREKKTMSIHRWVFMQTYGPIPDGMCVLHICDNTRCINPEHFFLGTHADNVADRIQKGRSHYVHGEAHGSAKLTEEEVMTIFASSEKGAELSKKYSVSETTIYAIKNSRKWNWLTKHERK